MKKYTGRSCYPDEGKKNTCGKNFFPFFFVHFVARRWETKFRFFKITHTHTYKKCTRGQDGSFRIGMMITIDLDDDRAWCWLD